jgi:Domain of unknown function (DUF4926)
MKVLDVVALLKDWPEKKLLKGQVGAIVDQIDENVYEVEFVDSRSGKTLAMESFRANDLMLLHFELETA